MKSLLLSFHLKNLKNIFISNSPGAWESMYQEGQWEFLKSLDQRPRYYTIGGLIRDRFPNGADILDVGCGDGILYSHLNGLAKSYTGLDLSDKAIQNCRQKFGKDGSCSFLAQDFESYQAGARYDAVVLNEVLYYFPWTSVPRVLRKIRTLLKEDGLLIISMNKNPKAKILWGIVHRSLSPLQSIRVQNTRTGSCWTVRTYSSNQKERLSEMMPASAKTALRVLFAGLGLFLLIGMIQKIGWSAVQPSIAAIGWPAMMGLILLYGIFEVSFCYGWYWTLGKWRVLGIRGIWKPFLASDALNCSIPSANSAGEPIKVAMLKPRVPIEEGAASVTIYKFSDFLSHILFLGLGLAVSVWSLSFPAFWYWGAGFVWLGMITIAIFFLRFQRKGFYGPMVGKIGRWFGAGSGGPTQATAEGIDQVLRQFYKYHTKEFALSFFFNFLGWFGGVLETYLCLRWLGLTTHWTYALAIETFALFLNGLAFFVPARLGILESSRAVIFSALGFPAASGMAYGIVRRVRELAWIALGYGVLALYGPKSMKPAATETSATVLSPAH